jgi:hypothetical protein
VVFNQKQDCAVFELDAAGLDGMEGWEWGDGDRFPGGVLLGLGGVGGDGDVAGALGS